MFNFVKGEQMSLKESSSFGLKPDHTGTLKSYGTLEEKLSHSEFESQKLVFYRLIRRYYDKTKVIWLKI